MSDWQEFCDLFKIDPNDPDQFDKLLESWSEKDRKYSRISFGKVNLKEFFQYHANPDCVRCGGAGYIGNFKHVEDGRCFQCIPDSRWEDLSRKSL